MDPIIGDFNGDGQCNDEDLEILRAAFGSLPGHVRWNEACDLTGPDGVPDGRVDILDWLEFAKHYVPTPPPEDEGPEAEPEAGE